VAVAGHFLFGENWDWGVANGLGFGASFACVATYTFSFVIFIHGHVFVGWGVLIG